VDVSLDLSLISLSVWTLDPCVSLSLISLSVWTLDPCVSLSLISLCGWTLDPCVSLSLISLSVWTLDPVSPSLSSLSVGGRWIPVSPVTSAGGSNRRGRRARGGRSPLRGGWLDRLLLHRAARRVPRGAPAAQPSASAASAAAPTATHASASVPPTSRSPVVSEPTRSHASTRKVANRDVWDFGWEMSSRDCFATPADFPPHECSPCSHVHVRRESL
jgi:hypothetical protein